MASIKSLKIKKNDSVLVISGKDRGKIGLVERVIKKNNKAIISGVNLSKKHLKPSRKNPHGGILDIAMPIEISNLMVKCPHCSKAVRVAYKIVNNKKERICGKCKTNLDVKESHVKA